VWPADRQPGGTPPEFEPYLSSNAFKLVPPIGERYDWSYNWGPFQVTIGVWSDPPPLEEWQAFDAVYDDGDLNTGSIRRHNNNLCMRIR
jgi:hypothetical protein